MCSFVDISYIFTLFVLSCAAIVRLEITMRLQNLIVLCTMTIQYLSIHMCIQKTSPLQSTQFHLLQYETEFQKTRRPFLSLCMAALHTDSPWKRKKTTISKQTSTNTVKSSSKTCLLFGHLLYVVPWAGIIGNLWRYTLLQTCHDTLTKTGSLNPNSCFTKQNYSSHLYNTGKSVQTVSNCNVNSLPKYSVPPLRVGNDLHKWTATQRRENPEHVKCLFRLR